MNMINRKYVNSKGITRYEYFKTCPDCGEESWISYKPKSNMVRCTTCSGKHLAKNMHKANTKTDSEKIRYERVCVNCGDIKMLIGKPITPKDKQLCGVCSRLIHGKAKAKTYTVTCIVCDETREVQGKRASLEKYCDKHKPKSIDKKINPKPIKKTKSVVVSKTKQVSQQAIDRARAINREHRESLCAKEVKIIPVATMSDEEMVKQWLDENKPTVEEDIEYEPWHTGLKVNGQYSVW